MSHHSLREDQTCLNCRHVVTDRFCSHCGQENIEPKQPFWYLIVHFIEDFTHYEGNFWRTLRKMLFQPGYLTNVYLQGQRARYLPPVRLYIFVSFISFLLFSILIKQGDTANVEVNVLQPRASDSSFVWKHDTVRMTELPRMVLHGKLSARQADSIQFYHNLDYKIKQREAMRLKYVTQFELDSARIADKQMSDLEYGIYSKVIKFTDKYTFAEIQQMVMERFFAFMPKVLFFYLPFFTLLSWLFYRRKRNYYFEHGIFTLHYFSSVLIILMLIWILSYIQGLLNLNFLNPVFVLLYIGLFAWMFISYYIACHRVFQSNSVAVIIKSSLLIGINCIILFSIFIGLILYLLYNFH